MTDAPSCPPTDPLPPAELLTLLEQTASSVRDVTIELLHGEEPYKDTAAALRELIAGLHATFTSHDQRMAIARQAILVLNEMHARLLQVIPTTEEPAATPDPASDR
jgi:uncharacterized membrane protein YccC